jgi:hypothetical protein
MVFCLHEALLRATYLKWLAMNLILLSSLATSAFRLQQKALVRAMYLKWFSVSKGNVRHV